MCGIVGMINHSEQIDVPLLKAMRDTLMHRGPDDAGVWINREGDVGLAHRRLSIIDTSPAGHQPMFDEKNGLCIIFNGEIYNFLEIRAILEQDGYTFKGKSDTEVILKAFVAWGIHAVEKFKGMFAIGLYNNRLKIIYLFRDRIGQKPLYYSSYRNKFVFASEIKAIMKDPDFKKDLDLSALNRYLSCGYVPGSMSILQGISKLLPAHILEYHLKDGSFKTYPYWNFPCMKDHNSQISERDIVNEVENRLTNAVHERLISDVPLGVFLSGGLDSSLICALMAEKSTTPVKTFSIGFSDDQYNELPYAKIVADYFSTSHHEYIIEPNIFEIIPKIIDACDEPLADSSIIPTYYLSNMTRRSVTVALSGDGGDECFSGYKTYLLPYIYERMNRYMPKIFGSLISKMGQKFDLIAWMRFLRRAGIPSNDIFLDMQNGHFFNLNLRNKILKEDVKNVIGSEMNLPELQNMRLLGEANTDDLINRYGYFDFKSYLPDNLLVKVDRASMINGLEVRNPFLDHLLVEYLFNKIQGSQKVKKFRTKYLLKEIAKRHLPQQLNVNRKQGFSLPLSKWMTGVLLNKIEEVVMQLPNDIFEKNALSELFNEHRRIGQQDKRIFSLFILSLWMNKYLGPRFQ